MSRIEEQDFDEKRLARRQRRKKSQLIAYITLGTIVVLVVGLLVFGIHMLTKAIGGRKTPVDPYDGYAEAGEYASEETAVIETPEETQEVREYTEEEILEEIVGSVLSEMTLEDKVAGLFLVTPEQLTGVDTAVKAGSGTQEALAQYAVGGVVYAPKNIKTTDQIKEMLSSTTSMSKYPVFAVLSPQAAASENVQSTLSLIPDAEITDKESAAAAGEKIGSELFKYGFNLAIAPDMEVKEDGEFGSDLEKVRENTAAYAVGLQATGVASCGYIFPVKGDTASGLSASDKTREDLVTGEFEVFKNSLDQGMNAVMVTSVSLPELTGDNTPACLSERIIEDELRGALGFEGIVVTAPLNEGAITQYYTSAEAVVAAIKAGADMVYIPENFQEAYEGLLAEVREGSLNEERVDESLRRIYSVKYADRVRNIANNK
jgi:beta-N-acetylhexosaminidase